MRGNTFAVGSKPNATCFKPGSVPWNSGISVHLSPATEFKKNSVPVNKLGVGSVRIRFFSRGNTQRAFIKVAEPNVWMLRANHVWESVHGPLPKGMLVHHKDRDPLNDTIDNLEAMTRAQHLAEHRPEFEMKRAKAASKSRWG